VSAYGRRRVASKAYAMPVQHETECLLDVIGAIMRRRPRLSAPAGAESGLARRPADGRFGR
jgi:hypothetical protein